MRAGASGGAGLLALFLVSLTLRPQIVGIAPLFPEIQDDLDVSHAVVGLLATIPVLCMGVFAPLAPYLASRLGTVLAMGAAAAVIGVFGLMRAGAPQPWLVIALTLPVGIGMGVGNTLAPLVVRERASGRPGAATGVYAGGIQIGAAVSAALAVPLAAWLGGWRAALAVFSLASCVLAVTWLALLHERGRRSGLLARAERLPWRSRTAWLLVAIFALMGSSYYALNAWLPDAYVENGWSEREAGLLLALLNLSAIPATMLVPWLSDRRGGRQPYLTAMSAGFLLSVVLLTTAPAGGYAWALVGGVAIGSMFALVMTLPLDVEDDPARVGAVVAMMLGLGYTLSALAPFALGAVRDLTGSFDASLWAIVVLLMACVASVVELGRERRRPVDVTP